MIVNTRFLHMGQQKKTNMSELNIYNVPTKKCEEI
jgi:hypothetical protein